jgi:hypothetical protein
MGRLDGGFSQAQDYSTGRRPRSVVCADFNKDGFVDVAVSNSDDGTKYLLRGAGDARSRGVICDGFDGPRA